MNLNGGTDYIVTGIVEDVHDNSHFTFKIIIPYESRRNWDTDWQMSSFYTYAIFNENTVAGKHSTTRCQEFTKLD